METKCYTCLPQLKCTQHQQRANSFDYIRWIGDVVGARIAIVAPPHLTASEIEYLLERFRASLQRVNE